MLISAIYYIYYISVQKVSLNPVLGMIDNCRTFSCKVKTTGLLFWTLYLFTNIYIPEHNCAKLYTPQYNRELPDNIKHMTVIITSQ